MAPLEHLVPAATACITAEPPLQIPNCVPSAEHTNAPVLEQALEPMEAPATGVAAAAAEGEGEARIVAVPGTAAEGEAAWACPAAAAVGAEEGEAAEAVPALELPAAALFAPHLGPVGGLVAPVPAF